MFLVEHIRATPGIRRSLSLVRDENIFMRKLVHRTHTPFSTLRLTRIFFILGALGLRYVTVLERERAIEGKVSLLRGFALHQDEAKWGRKKRERKGRYSKKAH